MNIFDQIIFKYFSHDQQNGKANECLDNRYEIQQHERKALSELLDENCLKLPKKLKKQLAEPLQGDLYLIEMSDDDLTPMEYVVEILYGCFDQDEIMAIETMLKTHQNSSSQILAGDKENLDEVIQFVIADARKKKYPLQLNLIKAD